MGGACGLPRACKGLFTYITQALNPDDTDPEERKVIQATTPDLLVDLRALPVDKPVVYFQVIAAARGPMSARQPHVAGSPL